ncbi:19520_t:CDS:2 [Gigaspora margarita]|uniref:19520_t:CDS:1 n=1 Tax=Gigaspora margarita TaxID=4874 RepID=A0ABN7UIQ1_GIGMA|nr:19520_t:CDS:2 [Gigaspora margarita]
MPHPKPKFHIASSKPCTEIGTFTIQFQVPENTNKFVEAPDNWELFEVTDEYFQNYALKAIEWHQEADKKIKSTFYIASKRSKNMKTLNEMWDTQQKQLMEECYNELKKQFHVLQNTKNQMAKSQPYDVQRLSSIFNIIGIWNTKHMACCLKKWTKDYLIQGFLPSQQQEKHAKRILLLDNEDIKLAACRHEKDDIKKYRIEWALRMRDSRHVLVTHDKVYFYANDDNSFFWVKDNESFIKKKDQEFAIMVSNFMCACYGPKCLTEADAKQLGLDRDAHVNIKPGHQSDAYWKSVFCFDQSTNHYAYALDVLLSSRMTLHPKVEKYFTFKDAIQITSLALILNKNHY